MGDTLLLNSIFSLSVSMATLYLCHMETKLGCIRNFDTVTNLNSVSFQFWSPSETLMNEGYLWMNFWKWWSGMPGGPIIPGRGGPMPGPAGPISGPEGPNGSYTQCAAVMTCWLVIRDPPQYGCLFRGCSRYTCQGYLCFSLFTPPAIRVLTILGSGVDFPQLQLEF